MELLGILVLCAISFVGGVAVDSKSHTAVMAVVTELKHLGSTAEELLSHLQKKA